MSVIYAPDEQSQQLAALGNDSISHCSTDEEGILCSDSSEVTAMSFCHQLNRKQASNQHLLYLDYRDSARTAQRVEARMRISLLLYICNCETAEILIDRV